MIIKGKNIYKVYISGAITNNPNFKKEFESVGKLLKEKGLIPLSPIRTYAHKNKESERCCMFDSIKLMEQAEAMIQISDLKKSEGMRIEKAIAKKCGIPIIKLEDLK